ncbi:unnamed protein product [Arctia plantaginis]|uniref:Uncharacterized protein n=1 Tax=Arctia plantaginis TaxID=874455 RepID=A0A8S0ZXF3_ARCPL|nr:unnamed protein product [Arctia plantaginis]
MGGEFKKSFNILLNDTEAMKTAGLDVKNEKMLSSKPDKQYIKQIVRLLNERFSTTPNIRESKRLGNIPQGVDLVSRAVNMGGEFKKSFHILLNDTDAMKTAGLDVKNEKMLSNKPNKQYLKQIVRLLNERFSTPPNIRESKTPGNIPQGNDAYYNTPPQVRVVKHPKLLQKHKKKMSEDLETTPSNNVYYNTPPVVLGVDSNAILKKQYGIEKHITQRTKVPRYIPRKYNIFHNRAQGDEGYRRNRTISKKHIWISPMVTKKASSLVDVLQITLNKSTVNTSDKSPVSQKSGLRKRFHEPLRQESTFAAINILQGDEALQDVPQPVPATYDEQEESSEKEFSAPPNIMRSSSLAPGDVLYGFVFAEQSTKDPQIEAYYQKMEANNIGYLSVAFEGLCEHLASKKQEHVTEIVKHTEFIVEVLQNTGRLRWLGEPMTTILRDLSILLATDTADVLQVRAMILKSLMQQRRKIVGTDVNEVLDYADSLISKKHGEHLLTVIQDVKQYPNVNKNGKELCKEIIEAFETPFFHLSGTKDLEHMVKNANKAFADRFQQYSDLRQAKDHPTGGSSPTGLKPSLKQRMPQNIVHSPKVLTVTKSRSTTQAIKHHSRDKHPSQNKLPSIDKEPLKDERQPKVKHLLKDKRHAKHKHSSRLEHPTKKKHSSSNPTEGEEEHGCLVSKARERAALPAAERSERAALPAAERSERDALPAAERSERDALPATKRSERDALPAAERSERDALPATKRSERDALPAAKRSERDALPAGERSERASPAPLYLAKKTPILRSANDDIKIDLRTARKPDDILKQVALPTSEPPDFMDNKYTGFSLPTKKSTSFSSPVIDVYTTNMDKEGTNGNPNFFVTLQAISKQTTRKVKKPPKVQDQLMAKDPAAFWADVATHGHWSHLDSYLTISYWKNSNRTSTYATSKF